MTQPRSPRISGKWILAVLTAALALVSWAVFSPEPAEAAGTTYYVDSVGGSDGNSGTSPSSAWKNLSAVNARTFQPGDKILLKAGSVWTDQYLDLKGSGTSASPIVVDQYDVGAKPVIDFGNTRVDGNGFGVRLKNVSYWEINNLEIRSRAYEGDENSAEDIRRHGVFVVGEGAGAGNFKHIYLRNLYIHDIFGTDRRTGGINFHAKGGNSDPESTWDDILVENCIIINVADTGIQTMTDALLADNTAWTHEFDAFTNVVIRNNYVEGIHRDGILVRASYKPLVEYNATNKIGKMTTADPAKVKYLDWSIAVVAAQWSYSANEALFQYNEAFDTKRISGDGQAWDFDQKVFDSIYQYNYSHNNQGGTLLVMWDTDRNTFRYNVSQNDLDMSQGAFDLQGTTGKLAGNLYAYNNVIYRTAGQTNPLTKSLSGNYGFKAYYTNNIFYNTANGTYETNANAVYSHNLFYGNNARVPNDPNKLIADPMFVEPGAATSRATAYVYKLKPGSPAINSGVAVANNGGKDFFGNPLYNGSPDRGAHEYSGDSPSPEPAPTTMFEDDFEDGNANGWTTFGGSWSVATDGTKVYAQTTTSGEAIAYAGNGTWSDYSYEAQIELNTVNGNAGLLFRYADASNYYMLRLNDSNDRLELYKKAGGTMTLVASSPAAVSTGQFYTLKAVVTGGNVRGYLNGVKQIDWDNPNSELLSGKIGIRMHSSAANVDQAAVYSIVSGLPLGDDFEDGNANGWTTFGGAWSVATDGTKVYAQTSASGEAIAYRGLRTWDNYTVEGKVKLNTTLGNAGLVFRYIDPSNYYMFRLNDNGDKAELYKKVNGQFTLLASVSQSVATGQWYTLKVTVSGNNVKGDVNGTLAVDWTNPATQLTTGKAGFRMHSTSASFDDFRVTE